MYPSAAPKSKLNRSVSARVLDLVQSAALMILALILYLALPFLFGYFGAWEGAAILIGLFVSFGAVIAGTESLKRWLQTRSPCAHGTKGGEYGSCETCAINQRLLQQQAQAEAARHAREKEIREKALALRSKEIKRLSAAWLTQSNAYLSMTPRQFEDAIAELFRRLGYKVQQTPFSNDGGKDAIAWKDGKKFLIECKRFGERTSVGRRDVQILHSAVVDAKAEKGIFVTTSSYAHTAVEYAKKNNLEIYDRAAIPWLVSQAYGPSLVSSSAEVMCYECGETISLSLGESTPSGVCKNGHEVLMNITLNDLGVAHLLEPPIPTCPRCGSSMRTVSKFGRRPFWGCSKFPQCRGTKLMTSR